MNTVNHSPILEKYCQDRMYALAKTIDLNVAVVLKPKPWWMPTFIYRAVIKGSVEVVSVGGIATCSYTPEI